MNPHRVPDWKKLAADSEAQCADLIEQVGVLRATVRGHKRWRLAHVFLSAVVSAGILGAFGFCATVVHGWVVRPPEPPPPPPPCADSAGVRGEEHSWSCRPDQTLSVEHVEGALHLYRCTCVRGAAP